MRFIVVAHRVHKNGVWTRCEQLPAFEIDASTRVQAESIVRAILGAGEVYFSIEAI